MNMDEIVLTAIIQELPTSEGGGYSGFIEEIPGAITQGSTLEEVRSNLQEAASTMLELQRESAKDSLDPNAIRTIRERIRVVSET